LGHYSLLNRRPGNTLNYATSQEGFFFGKIFGVGCALQD